MKRPEDATAPIVSALVVPIMGQVNQLREDQRQSNALGKHLKFEISDRHATSKKWLGTVMISAGAFCIGGIGGCHANNPPAGAPAGSSVVDGAGFPEQARVDTESAYNLIVQGKYAEAEPILKRAIDADPMYGPAHNDMGLVYYETDRLYEAAWELEKAIKRMPDQPQPRNNLGLVLEKAGKMQDALEQFTQAAQIDPNNAEYLGNLASIRVRLEMNDDDTHRILESLILHESRPQWLHWARFALIRLKNARSDTQPATLPDS